MGLAALRWLNLSKISLLPIENKKINNKFNGIVIITFGFSQNNAGFRGLLGGWDNT